IPLSRLFSSATNTTPGQRYEIPPSRLQSKSHPQGFETIQAQVEPYFASNWKFASEKEKKGFLALGFSRAFSQFFPLTLNDRVETTCKMHYLALLIDDQLEKMDASEMLSYRDRVMGIANGAIQPDREICLEWMLSDTIRQMHSMDDLLVHDLIQGFCTLLRAQTATERRSIRHLGPYLGAREVDVGRPFYTALMRFGANLHLTPTELSRAADLETSAFRFMGVLNDIYSWNREWRVYQENPIDGARPFSAIYILSQETGLPYAACKRLMYSYCRELEIVLKQSGDDIRSASAELTPDMEKYIKGLEYLMSGVETWSQWTPRYKEM
ncbi:hypothetical protein N7474_001088, partial [Penicillium riverlandense]|uniref:uncharacterized protein n=1 Tax=Penicillium riverlandense TaxID=1903569 RepID=UPI002548A2EC